MKIDREKYWTEAKQKFSRANTKFCISMSDIQLLPALFPATLFFLLG